MVLSFALEKEEEEGYRIVSVAMHDEIVIEWITVGYDTNLKTPKYRVNIFKALHKLLGEVLLLIHGQTGIIQRTYDLYENNNPKQLITCIPNLLKNKYVSNK